MKTTSNAGAFLKSASETTLPLVSGSLKSGAFVPSGNIVEFTATMGGNLPQLGILVDVKGCRVTEDEHLIEPDDDGDDDGRARLSPARRAVVLLGAAIDAPIIFLSSAWHNPCNIIKNACGSLLSCTFR